MDFRVDIAILESHTKGSRFGLTLHNLSEKSYAHWRLSFTFDRYIDPSSISGGQITQVGSFCTLDIIESVLYSNHHVYVEFSILTAPFRFLSDGIKEAYLDTDSLSRAGVSVSPIVLKDPHHHHTPTPDVNSHTHQLIPEPMSFTQSDGVFELTRYSQITCDHPESKGAAEWLQQEVERLFSITPKSIGQQGIHFKRSPVLSKEEYKLNIDSSGITIEATSDAGFIYAASTLIQLFHFDEARQTLTVPFVSIQDKPRFSYRGVMLDSARHFQPVDEIKRFINLLAHYKFNTFHWHLTDDEGWRIEIKALPALTDIGAWRGPEEVLEPQFHHISNKYGGFYSQQEIKDIVAFAAVRGIQVIPEIDIPGHCRAAIKSLPEMLVDHDDRSTYRSVQHYTDNTLSPGIAGTYQFLDIVLEEVSQLFPAPYFHIGADEVPIGSWANSPNCQKLMQTHGYNNTKELQGHLLRYAEDKLRSLGKRMLGWEEAHFGNKVSKDTVIYSWLSEEAAINCAKMGYDVVLQPAQTTYLDMAQDRTSDEPGVDWASVISLEQAYQYEPLSDIAHDDPINKRILGIQAALWTELIAHQDRLDYMVFPRLLALSETAWSHNLNKNYSHFLARLKPHLTLLDRQRIQYRPPWSE
ncbi:beta-hexosaminidase [Vibrio sp. 10N.286.49.C2]|uniref:beta-N-acetylhexosaminidase n=1 Tax=unclassified Vibrio TaxID=2614977 RepID=UPI000C8425FD|nr:MULTISPECIES: family 20 glycosylhydrolase [unclassified Vibrio]PMH27510.1 beta-hexosaminidase [Vibrio sp. 10N.286.49.C2]PMH53082.1 beta-hexosaminidase [Vibrio sp. 10N.286.49.B1]PMH80262.1 beta-hexosaminidase [Vibrio sp. 10N.286.48.B7]